MNNTQLLSLFRTTLRREYSKVKPNVGDIEAYHSAIYRLKSVIRAEGVRYRLSKYDDPNSLSLGQFKYE